MMRILANFLLRLYPRTWRMRYEEEVRALLDDRAPQWRDVAGLVRGASREWLHGIVDPVELPIHLSSSPELEQASAEVARLNREARAAAEVWRQSRPFSIPASEQR